MNDRIDRKDHVSASNDNRYDPGNGPRNRSLRVGDKERDAVIEILRQRHVEGRLDADEFQARLDCCLAAKTYAELDELIADFPREDAERERGRHPRTWRPLPLPFVLVPVALIVAIAVGAQLAWFAVPLLFFLVIRPLLWRAWGGYGRGVSWACGPRRATRV
jgi:Domain of unknown function (DUF1707)